MTLADAIRKGAMQREQAFGEYVSTDGQRTCVLGAAFEGLFGEPPDEGGYPYDVLVEQFPSPTMKCPVSDCRDEDHLCGHAMHLNDHHKWTREAIADWVQSVEDAAR